MDQLSEYTKTAMIIQALIALLEQSLVSQLLLHTHASFVHVSVLCNLLNNTQLEMLHVVVMSYTVCT